MKGGFAMMATITSYRAVTRDIEAATKRVASEAVNQRATETYRERISSIKTIDDFLKDERVYQYALKAHGLEDMAYAKAFIRKVLEEGVDAKDAFANKLSDSRYRELAETFNFKRYGETATVFSRAQEGTVAKYNRAALEVSAGEENEGVRLALYFERKAAALDNVYDLIADPALARVVQVATALPQSIGALDVDKQAAMIEWRVDLASLKEPETLSRFIERFTALWDVEATNAAASAPLDGAAALFANDGLIGPDGDALLALQSWRPYR
jgi:hypothetical protein